MDHKIERLRRDIAGRVVVPMLLWFAGVPLILVVAIWFFFFRG
jgi:hypothetical protein